MSMCVNVPYISGRLWSLAVTVSLYRKIIVVEGNHKIYFRNTGDVCSKCSLPSVMSVQECLNFFFFTCATLNWSNRSISLEWHLSCTGNISFNCHHASSLGRTEQWYWTYGHFWLSLVLVLSSRVWHLAQNGGIVSFLYYIETLSYLLS